MLDTIHAKRDAIYAITRKHKAEKLWVFGSVARKEERSDSDFVADDRLHDVQRNARIRRQRDRPYSSETVGSTGTTIILLSYACCPTSAAPSGR